MCVNVKTEGVTLIKIVKGIIGHKVFFSWWGTALHKMLLGK